MLDWYSRRVAALMQTWVLLLMIMTPAGLEGVYFILVQTGLIWW